MRVPGIPRKEIGCPAAEVEIADGKVSPVGNRQGFLRRWGRYGAGREVVGFWAWRAPSGGYPAERDKGLRRRRACLIASLIPEVVGIWKESSRHCSARVRRKGRMGETLRTAPGDGRRGAMADRGKETWTKDGRRAAGAWIPSNRVENQRPGVGWRNAITTRGRGSGRGTPSRWVGGTASDIGEARDGIDGATG